ncbi:Transcriptional regulator, LuxR family [Modestobacter italicus]|uniref:Transcriptional regulator, LuxR family n=1 Tax=Modestobacter italicus (strain DSM 44449 / CECT 9708 / BC 501) TaxID=2732864 RepID=I4EV39_MODI5|nr:Transcriptional regulator, LuxR family [Modestobacter marinus]
MVSTSELYAADVEALVRVLDEAREDAAGEAMPWALLDGLLRVVPCDSDVTYQHHDHQARRTLCIQTAGLDGVHAGPAPDEGDGPDDPFWQYWWQGPTSWPQRTGDLRSVICTRDFYPTEQDWLADPISETLPQIRRAMLVSLPAAPGEARRVAFLRGSGPDFTERERQIAMLLRPHLQEIWLDAERRRAGVPQLTAREWEVLALAAAGMPYARVAERLFISVGTVRKHMEHVRERLGVHSIPAAAARAMPHAPAHLRVPRPRVPG